MKRQLCVKGVSSKRPPTSPTVIHVESTYRRGDMVQALVYCHGSRGDVEPYLALAHALQRAGHSAVLAAPRLFLPAAEKYGVPFAPLDDEIIEFMTRPEFREVLQRSDAMTESDRKRKKELFAEVFPRTFSAVLRDMWNAAAEHGADLVVHSHNHREAAGQIAEKLGVPHVLASLYPNFVRSRSYPYWERTYCAPQPSEADENPFETLPARALAAWRADVLGLPPRADANDFRHRADGTPAPVLHGFSPHLLQPADDWPDWVHTTGFWSLPRATAWTPPDILRDFLADGDKPIFIGFGSSLAPDPGATGRLVRDAVRRAGVRAVVVAGWGGIEIPGPAPDILTVTEVPYDWLLPRVRAAVHAGGAGALNAALQAGIPQVSCPFHKEQLMWAKHLQAAGVAPAPLLQRDLTSDGLAGALRRAVTDPDLARTATRLARQVRTEHGAERAVRVLERIHTEQSGERRAGDHA
ncbi:glycosyltransferase [Streptomyces caniferus]|uniref:glycosyltransferase n=1 Tax=Streptomyces caniferus TaxID=285557 RepID=UPI0034062602